VAHARRCAAGDSTGAISVSGRSQTRRLRLIIRDDVRGCRRVGPGAACLQSAFLIRMAKSTAPTAAAPPEPSYEDALAELERLVASMEGGQLPLDRLLQTYQRGAELLNLCRARLDAVEQQVKVLEDGKLKPWAAS
jgi:exodeoxyribonuclease VII small subunit